MESNNDIIKAGKPFKVFFILWCAVFLFAYLINFSGGYFAGVDLLNEFSLLLDKLFSAPLAI